ncbi:MAG: cupin domain-containing protein [Actinomycetes bacterium]
MDEPFDLPDPGAVPAPFGVDLSEVAERRWGAAGPGAVSWRTVLGGDETRGRSLTAGVAEVAPGDPGRTFVHRHAPDELYFVLGGDGVVQVAEQEFPVRAGSTVFVPGGAWHSARNTGDEVLRILYVFAVDSFDDVVYEYRDGRPD